MKATILLGILFSAAFLPACTSTPPLLPTSVIEDAPELTDEASIPSDARPRRKLRTNRAKETPRKVQVEERRTTPVPGSPEWQREWERAQAQDEEKDRRLDRTIRSICRGC